MTVFLASVQPPHCSSSLNFSVPPPLLVNRPTPPVLLKHGGGPRHWLRLKCQSPGWFGPAPVCLAVLHLLFPMELLQSKSRLKLHFSCGISVTYHHDYRPGPLHPRNMRQGYHVTSCHVSQGTPDNLELLTYIAREWAMYKPPQT